MRLRFLAQPHFFMQIRRDFLPFNGFVENSSVLCILGIECIAAILDAKHHERFSAVVTHAATSFRSDTDNGTFLHGKDITVNLKLTVAFKKGIKFFMVFVGVKEACFLTGSENLKRKICACCTDCPSAEYLAGNLYFRSEFENVILNVVKLAEIDSTEVSACFYCLNLFNIIRYLI